ncbi:methionine-rich copper-binding protein CopC [Micromonospora sp. HB375]|uniref:copper resistance CopC family protein n=1 Tax=Micromonospora TaxID=1873 RepID=UPI001AE66628|nr:MULTISPECIES: copper resistance CopC family protein [unclassified Micromonospora]MBP1783932.1 methionine-rich copper-binding protein CopC [Micromonospora sp. HB375]MDH6470311.1 methionine-rich copper-binding protein CopC [Micromonospora sp. H404/HB375]
MRTRTVSALLAALFTTALLLVPATPAAAHNSLQEATPARDARLTTAPTQVTLRFLQRLNPAFTTITLRDATDRQVPASAPAVDGATGTVTIEEPLANGTYTVVYRVVSRDGHPVQGSYRFTVADPAAPPAAAPSPATPSPAASADVSAGAAAGADASPASADASADADGGLPVGLLVGGAVAAVAAAGVTALLLRRRRAA